jgi:predicted PhzF superfamily epimerase YddE/YHI9
MTHFQLSNTFEKLSLTENIYIEFTLGCQMAIGFYKVDAFTNRAFKGNPAAVCVLSSPQDDTWMQNIAMEMNLSETAFLYPLNNGYSLRWFTPLTEVNLCGHATLASAHILWEKGYLKLDSQAIFFTKSGVLTANKILDWIELDFPSEPETESKYPTELIEGLGVQVKYIGRNKYDYLVEVESEEVLRGLKPNWSILEQIETRGIIVTSKSLTPEYDFISRAFFPSLGVNEDPVTGSAHCCLGSFWKERLHKNEFIAFQASKRGGVIRISLKGERVILSGQAITVMTGEILND